MSQSEDQTKPTKYKHPAYFSEFDGVYHMPGSTKEILKCVAGLETRTDDVIIASWPKSGTTWMMEIVWQLFNDAKISHTRVDEKVQFLELLYWPTPSGVQRTPDDVRTAFAALPSPRLIKTHLPYEDVPKGDINLNNGPKFILVVRNPKDCVVSYYHHYTGFANLECDCSWDEFFELFMDEKLICGSWFQYMRGWWEHRNDPNILVIKYEDIKRDVLGTIEKITSFVNLPLSKQTMEQVVEQTTFDIMQKNPAFDHSWFGKKPGSHFQFIRKGKVGDWKNYFTIEQNKRFEERFVKEMNGTGLTLDFFK